MNILNADIVLSTTPGLDVFQWKRSKGVKYYVHIPHHSTNMVMYHMFGIDYYDAILVSGEHQIDQIRQLESIRNIEKKDIELVGLPYYDVLGDKVKNNGCDNSSSNKTVILAPTWGKNSALNVFGEKLIDALLETGYNIIIRPHPQSLVSEPKLIEHLKYKYPDGKNNVSWDHQPDNFDSLNKSDILISDYSGVIYDYAVIFDKPVIYADIQIDLSQYDAYWLDDELWTKKVLPQIGKKLTLEDLDNIKNVIDDVIGSDSYKEARNSLAKKLWVNRGESAKNIVNYLERKAEDVNS